MNILLYLNTFINGDPQDVMFKLLNDTLSSMSLSTMPAPVPELFPSAVQIIADSQRAEVGEGCPMTTLVISSNDGL